MRELRSHTGFYEIAPAEAKPSILPVFVEVVAAYMNAESPGQIVNAGSPEFR
jgi:hypothetical protein